MNHDAYTISFQDLATRHHHNYVYKRLTTPSHHPSRDILLKELSRPPGPHQSPIQRLLQKTDLFLPPSYLLETIHPYPDPPWLGPRWEVENVGNKRDEVKTRIPEQIKEEKARGACVMVTDGSFIPDVGGGAAMAMEGLTAGHSYGPIEGISNYEMETMALMIALVQFRRIADESPNTYRSLAIFSDSQAALDLMTNPLRPTSLQYLARFLRRSVQRVPANLPIKLFWTPGHEGIELNEKADIAAKKAAEEGSETVTLPMSLGALLRHTRGLFHTRRAVPLIPYKTKAKKIADALNSLEKDDAAVIFQLQCGHCPLKKFLNRIGVEESQKCAGCPSTETVAHFLIYCKRYTTQRQVFRKILKEAEIKTNTNSAVALLDNPIVYPHLADFIRATGRFAHMKSYLEK